MPNRELTITPASRKAQAEWVERNPLRAWRKSQKLSILDAAGHVGVGMSMMQMYEKGAHRPGPGKHATMANLLGSDWSTRWDAWLNSRPNANPPTK